eukprot:TRINITY_DN12069_c1_g8_i1.p1 TRINITY_DN12069_c1_g8~~TRINITY_DN12069_c1_g8_i1.p1  ORF type:complete len:530 (+),score=114.75 TRINITY_DN12069_c1_g8_i1:172-1761(+)
MNAALISADELADAPPSLTSSPTDSSAAEMAVGKPQAASYHDNYQSMEKIVDYNLCCYGLIPRDSFMLLCISVAAGMSLLLGYDQGVMSGAKLSIRHDLDLNENQIQLMVGILHVSAFGALFSGWTADKYGRRPTIAMACAVFFTGALVMALAHSYEMLMLGRVITGIGVGTGLSLSPLYLSELSPKQIRGALVSLTEISINIGVLLGFIAGWAFDGLGEHVNWRWMLGMGCLPPVLILASLAVLPESPRWLLKQGHSEQAREVLRKTCPAEEVEETLSDLDRDLKLQQELNSSWRDLFGKRARGKRRLIVAGLLVAVFQQASGLEALLYYVPETLDHAGIKDKETQLLANIGVGAVKLIFVILAMCYTDNYGRRLLLALSGIGMALSSIIVASSFEAGDIVGVTIFGVCLFMATFSLGWGPMTWVVVSEVFPLQVRGPALGLATFLNRLTSGILTSTYISLSTAITPGGSFYMFAAIALLSVVFVRLGLPETRGQSLEAIDQAASFEFDNVNAEQPSRTISEEIESRA